MRRMQQQLSLWVILVVAAVGPAVSGVIARLGVFRGPWMKARTDLVQWRREQRLDAYAEPARTADDFMDDLLDLARPSWIAATSTGKRRSGPISRPSEQPAACTSWVQPMWAKPRRCWSRR